MNRILIAFFMFFIAGCSQRTLPLKNDFPYVSKDEIVSYDENVYGSHSEYYCVLKMSKSRSDDFVKLMKKEINEKWSIAGNEYLKDDLENPKPYVSKFWSKPIKISDIHSLKVKSDSGEVKEAYLYKKSGEKFDLYYIYCKSTSIVSQKK